MSCCTFVIIKNGKARYVASHYSTIKDLLQGTTDPDDEPSLSLYADGDTTPNYVTDTGFMPAVIINFDKKILATTPFNWFDNFEQYLKTGWTHKTINTR